VFWNCVHINIPFITNFFFPPSWTLNAFRYDKRRPTYCYQCNEPNILVEITASNPLSVTSCSDKHAVEKSTIFESTRENADVAVLTVYISNTGNAAKLRKACLAFSTLPRNFIWQWKLMSSNCSKWMLIVLIMNVIKLVPKSAFIILCLVRLVFLYPRWLSNIYWNDVVSGTVLVQNFISLEYNFNLSNFRILQRDIGLCRGQYATCLYFSDSYLKFARHVLGKSWD
jgi:hypothetical protein